MDEFTLDDVIDLLEDLNESIEMISQNLDEISNQLSKNNIISNYIDWLDTQDLNRDEIFCIYKSIERIERWGPIQTTKRESGELLFYFIFNDFSKKMLLLHSDDERLELLGYLKKMYFPISKDVDYWYKESLEIEAKVNKIKKLPDVENDLYLNL